QRYKGTITLSPHACITLKSQIDAYLAHHTDPELQDISSKLVLAPMLTQTLSGFNEALQMRRQVIQLMVDDPLAPEERALTDRARIAVGDGNDTAPQSLDGFNPIRA